MSTVEISISDSSEAAIGFDASLEIREVIRRLGRTEDLRLSPDNRRLIVLDYLTDRIFLFAIAIDPAGPLVRILACCIIESRALDGPHGVAFLDDEHIAVGSRSGDVDFFRLPPLEALPKRLSVEPLAKIKGRRALFATVDSPGSLDAFPVGPGRYRVLVCNNFWHFVSAHTITVSGDTLTVRNEGKLLEKKILLPDGISVSPDRQWIAISNHVQGQVLVYHNVPRTGPSVDPVGVLSGIVCPHGLRFDGNERLIVADAASQYLMVYERGAGWCSRSRPDRFIRMLDDETFRDGRYASREGGTKGLDIDLSGRVMITTHRLGTIECFDLERLRQRDDFVDETEFASLCESRDESIRRNEQLLVRRRGNVASRLLLEIAAQKRRARRKLGRFRRRRAMRVLDRRALASQIPLVTPGGPVVSLTSHGMRVPLVHRAIESIGAGTLKPSRIVLWLPEDGPSSNLGAHLTHAIERGLEIRTTRDYGPHTKFFPYVMSDDIDAPLVTADDDMLYPPDWLERLSAAHARQPGVIHCHRARRIGLQHGQLAPYNEWSLASDDRPSHLNFVTGVSGAILPPALLAELRRLGPAFENCCPRADDIWLSAVALRAGIPIAQIGARAGEFPQVLGTQAVRLYDENVMAGGNQPQLRRTYGPLDLKALNAAADRDWHDQSRSAPPSHPERGKLI